jgi:hypothetical protein
MEENTRSPKSRWKDNIRKERGWEIVDWFNLAQNNEE